MDNIKRDNIIIYDFPKFKTIQFFEKDIWNVLLHHNLFEEKIILRYSL